MAGPGDVILTPFMGIGSEVFEAVKNKRKAIGIELKPSYYKQAKAIIPMALEDGSEQQIELFPEG